jgi:hypothetical protein
MYLANTIPKRRRRSPGNNIPSENFIVNVLQQQPRVRKNMSARVLENDRRRQQERQTVDRSSLPMTGEMLPVGASIIVIIIVAAMLE